MQRAVEKFFKILFENKKRRLAILGRYICVYRTGFDDPIQLIKFYLDSIACEPSVFQLERSGMRLTKGFFIPYTWLTVDEQDIIKWFLDYCSFFFKQVEWVNEELITASHFRYDSVVFTQLQRMLILRDFCTICTLQQQLEINPRIPTYALLACKSLLVSHPDNKLLLTTHWMFDSLRGNAHELPITKDKGGV
jgi:hypothetical protein